MLNRKFSSSKSRTNHSRVVVGNKKMKKFNLIFLRSDKMLLSRKQYLNWREIQDEYDDYMASLDFPSIQEVKDYIKLDYKISEKKAYKETNKIYESKTDTIQIEL